MSELTCGMFLMDSFQKVGFGEGLLLKLGEIKVLVLLVKF